MEDRTPPSSAHHAAELHLIADLRAHTRLLFFVLVGAVFVAAAILAAAHLWIALVVLVAAYVAIAAIQWIAVHRRLRGHHDPR